MKFIKRNIILLFMLLALAGCKRSRGEFSEGGYVAGESEIGFSEQHLSTKAGTSLDESNFKSMKVYAYFTEDKSWSDADLTFSQFMYSQMVTKSDADGVWSYSPIKYWPNDTNDKLTFYAVAPTTDPNFKLKSGTGVTTKPEFTYTLPAEAKQGNDISLAFAADMTEDEVGVELNFNHAMTRINLEGKLEGYISQDYYLQYGMTNVNYYITDIALYNVQSKSDVKWDTADGAIVWDDSPYTSDTKITYTASQEGETLSKTITLNGGGADVYKELCLGKNAMFLIPQDVSNVELQVFVRKSYNAVNITYDEPADKTYYITKVDDNGVQFWVEAENVTDGEGVTSLVPISSDVEQEVIFETDKVAMPTPAESVGVWRTGDWLTLQFAFDCANESKYHIPMTVRSVIRPWREVDVDVDEPRSLYIYGAGDTIEVTNGSTDPVEYMICTNYDGDPSEFISIAPEGVVNYSVTKSDRTAEGLYVSGEDKKGDDPVYILTFDIDYVGLDSYVDGKFDFEISAEMIGEDGGVVTHRMPITMKKK